VWQTNIIYLSTLQRQYLYIGVEEKEEEKKKKQK